MIELEQNKQGYIICKITDDKGIVFIHRIPPLAFVECRQHPTKKNKIEIRATVGQEQPLVIDYNLKTEIEEKNAIKLMGIFLSGKLKRVVFDKKKNPFIRKLHAVLPFMQSVNIQRLTVDIAVVMFFMVAFSFLLLANDNNKKGVQESQALVSIKSEPVRTIGNVDVPPVMNKRNQKALTEALKQNLDGMASCE